MINQIETTNQNDLDEITYTNIFEHGEVAYFKPETPALDKNKNPLVDGGRVVTRVKTKEFCVVYRTHHANQDIQSIYEEFKMVDNKLFWLSENRDRLQKFDINVDALIESHKNV